MHQTFASALNFRGEHHAVRRVAWDESLGVLSGGVNLSLGGLQLGWQVRDTWRWGHLVGCCHKLEGE